MISSSTARPSRPDAIGPIPNSGGHRGVVDVQPLAASDAEHRVLPARREAEGEELFGIGAAGSVAAQLLGRPEIDLYNTVGRGAMTATSPLDGGLGGVQNPRPLFAVAHDFSESARKIDAPIL